MTQNKPISQLLAVAKEELLVLWKVCSLVWFKWKAYWYPWMKAGMGPLACTEAHATLCKPRYGISMANSLPCLSHYPEGEPLPFPTLCPTSILTFYILMPLTHAPQTLFPPQSLETCSGENKSPNIFSSRRVHSFHLAA